MRYIQNLSYKLLVYTLTFLLTLGPVHAEPSVSFAVPTPPVPPIEVTHFAEPLVATVSTTPAENEALRSAIAIYEKRSRPDDFSSLTKFLVRYPHSAWATALQLNLGLGYLHYGYFTRAADAWRQAWQTGKDTTDPHIRALVDRAVGELARLQAALGHEAELVKLFAELGDRAVSGSATEGLQVAREELELSRKDPRHLFICGPMALRALMASLGASEQQVAGLQWYKAGPDGTNLAEIGHLADERKFAHRLVYRKHDQAVPVPSIVHWKVGHFGAIIGQANGRFRVQDPVLPWQELWVTQGALDAEASGYFLVPGSAPSSEGWRNVDLAEAANVWGKGPTGNTPLGAAAPALGSPAKAPAGNGCMCGYNIEESTVSLSLSDSPVGYQPSIGPSAKISITYNQREDSQPAVFSFSNVSPKWTLNWTTYVTDEPGSPGVSVSRYLVGGGAYYYNGYNSGTGQFAAQTNDGSILSLVSQTPITYQRVFRTGAVETYAQSDGSTGPTRRIFLSKIVDPLGNALTLNYDSQSRLASVTDALGRQTTFSYGLPFSPLLITQITDPFGRSATLAYDSNGRLNSITDVIGLTSSFGYDSNGLVNVMTTPYGSTQFSYTAPGTAQPRYLQVTDPLGNSEREEWYEAPPGVSDTDPSSTVPTLPSGYIPLTNQYLEYRDSFHWSKSAYVVAGCTAAPPPGSGCDYTKARIKHFHHVPVAPIKADSIESIKYPLESRVWFLYPGQSNPPGSVYAGTFNKPTIAARVLDDGTTQLSQYNYNSATGNLVRSTDPVGRITTFAYAANGIDVLSTKQTVAGGTQETINQFTYNSGPACNLPHLVCTATDAAGQTTTYTYNSVGKLISVTSPLSQTTTFNYDTSQNLTSVVDANNVTVKTYTYDAFNRVRTAADSEGWTLTYFYDAANRVVRKKYPDGTSANYTYDKLDLTAYRDRQGRTWSYTYDADRRLTTIVAPLGQQKSYGYSYTTAGAVNTLTDPKGNITTWAYDVEGRLIKKNDPDTTALTYTYENTTSRLKSVLDPLGQTTLYGYTQDNSINLITYSGALNPTPTAGFTYDPYFARLTAVATNGTATTNYAYGAVGSIGALQLYQETSPVAGVTTTYGYDALGRLTCRTFTSSCSSSPTETFGYDTIGRLTSHDDELGSFTLSYLGETGQVTQRQLTGSSLSTTLSYLPNSSDRRLAGIAHTGLSAASFSNYVFTTTPQNFITGISESSDAAAQYPAVGSQNATYNNLNQLTSLSGQASTYDLNGNLLSDGIRNYSWDAENRLIKITYAGMSGKETDFTYDALGRRVAISSTPAGGGTATTTSYIFCGGSLCQARNASNNVIRSYHGEGELVPGGAVQKYYYGLDQVGSVRRVFASTGAAPAYYYDPYGNPLQSTTPLTDYVYAGMFYNADSGLYLTPARIYNPIIGRWLSRDPLGEATDPSANLYAYAGANPVSLSDPSGRFLVNIIIAAIIAAGEDAAIVGGAEAAVAEGAAVGAWAYNSAAAIAAALACAITCGSQSVGTADSPPAAATPAAPEASAPPVADGGSASDDPKAPAQPAPSDCNPAPPPATPDFGGNPPLPDPEDFEPEDGRQASPAEAQVTVNQANGNAFRNEVADALKAAGNAVETEVPIPTPFGRRVIDIQVSRGGRVLGGVETKLGRSRYLPSQRAKDAWLKANGYIVNVIRRGLY